MRRALSFLFTSLLATTTAAWAGGPQDVSNRPGTGKVTTAGGQCILAPFNVLSLDGGGVKIVNTIEMLRHVEEETGMRMHAGESTQYPIHMGTGSSAGGLLNLALGLGRPLQDCEQFFETELPRIFHEDWKREIITVAGLRSYHFDPGPLTESLQSFYGEGTRISSMKRPTMVTTMEIAPAQRPRLIKSWDAKMPWDSGTVAIDGSYDIEVWRAGLLTSAATTCFPATTAAIGGTTITGIDGGIFENNPSSMAFNAANHLLGHARRHKTSDGSHLMWETVVFSFGTGFCPVPDAVRVNDNGWIIQQAGDIIHYSTGSGRAHMDMLGRFCPHEAERRYHRRSPILSWDQYQGMDNADADFLKGLRATTRTYMASEEWKSSEGLLYTAMKRAPIYDPWNND